MNTFKKATVMAAGTAALVLAGAGAASAQADADGAAVDSPGVLSGNNIQVPIHIPVNVCGNTVDIVGVLNPTWGNTCINIDDDEHHGEHHEGHKNDFGGNHG
ncbi:chaplin [Embleya scabrispora]|uniref:chaplin n=1 Tax=Embleya scabrispora TaxID=159449 RepID=UPI000371E4E1|nr:chaplin [Embleya scabrispora]